MMAMAEAQAVLDAEMKPWVQAQAIEELLPSFREKLAELHLRVLALKKRGDFSGTSETEADADADLEAKLAKAKEEFSAVLNVYARLESALCSLDFSGMTEAERAAEAERRRQQRLQEARRLKMAGDLAEGCCREAAAPFLDFDPKQGGAYYNRFTFTDLSTFDIDEESPLGPMRFTDAVYKSKADYQLCLAVNIISVKIACSDVGFPLHVYGTVIARDSTDEKCLYLFRRDRDHCQLINSQDESLILTGPKRGLALLDYNYVETDLKIRDHQGQNRELSKGIIDIPGILNESLKKSKVVQIESIKTRLSTVDVMYAVVNRAVEATIAIEVVRGDFYGKVTAYTTSIKERLVLYDSKVAGAVTGDGHGVIQLMRPVVSVRVKDMLMIVFKIRGCKSRTIEFTPRVNGQEEDVITVGAAKFRVKVAWSIMDP